jgi:hypothetical protein
MYKDIYYHFSQVELHASPGVEFLGMTDWVAIK